jgi:hypothetical protein
VVTKFISTYCRGFLRSEARFGVECDLGGKKAQMEREGVPIYTDAGLCQPYNFMDGEARELTATQLNEDEHRTKMSLAQALHSPRCKNFH